MAISDKLNYLIETKSKFKDRLNSLGAEITASTTFRNYLNWLDTFYNQSSDKTDLAKNGIVGRTSQDGNPTPENPIEIETLSEDVEYKIRGKNLLDKYNNLFQGTFLTAEGGNDSIASSTMFRCCTKKIDISNLSGDITCSGGYFELFAFYDENNNLISYVQNPTTTIPNGTKNVRVRFFGDDTEIPVSTFQQLDLMVENNSTATTYEPYISEKFPLSLKSKNLFDKDNANIIKCGISYNKINASDSNRLLYISIQPNTTYTIQRRNDGNVNRFRAGTCSIVPANGVDLDNAIETDNAESITITSRENDTYLVVMYYRTQETTLTEQQILDSIQIEENSIPTDYEPYYDIELCNISDYKDKIYSNNGRFYLEKNTNKIILNGDELIDMFSVTGGKLFRCRDIAISVPETSPISNYFKGVPNSSSRYDGTVYYNYNASADRMVFDILTTKFTTVSEFKSWLLTHNTELQFAIPASSTTEITSSNYPELYNALKEIQDYLVSYKINKEFLLDYSSPEIEY